MYYIRIYDGNTLKKSCGTGTTCTYDVSQSSATTKTYTAKIVYGSDIQAESEEEPVTWQEPATTLPSCNAQCTSIPGSYEGGVCSSENLFDADKCSAANKWRDYSATVTGSSCSDTCYCYQETTCGVGCTQCPGGCEGDDNCAATTPDPTCSQSSATCSSPDGIINCGDSVSGCLWKYDWKYYRVPSSAEKGVTVTLTYSGDDCNVNDLYIYDNSCNEIDRLDDSSLVKSWFDIPTTNIRVGLDGDTTTNDNCQWTLSVSCDEIECTSDPDCTNNPKGNKCLNTNNPNIDNVCGCVTSNNCAWSGGTVNTFCPNVPPIIPPDAGWSANYILPTCLGTPGRCQCDPSCGSGSAANSRCAPNYCCTGQDPQGPKESATTPYTCVMEGDIQNPWLCT